MLNHGEILVSYHTLMYMAVGIEMRKVIIIAVLPLAVQAIYHLPIFDVLHFITMLNIRALSQVIHSPFHYIKAIAILYRQTIYYSTL